MLYYKYSSLNRIALKAALVVRLGAVYGGYGHENVF